MPEYPVRHKLPAAYSTAIGRVITRWAWLEWELKRVAYAILEIGPKAGRLSVREPRAHEYLTMIQDLMQVRKLSISDKLKRHMKPVKDTLVQHGDLRNALAHGIWIKRDDTSLPVLRIVSGDLFRRVNLPSSLPKAKIEPRALAIELRALRSMVDDIEGLIKFVQALRREIESQLAASHDTPASQRHVKAIHRSHNRAGRKTQPEPSQG